MEESSIGNDEKMNMKRKVWIVSGERLRKDVRLWETHL
jgi:hypothetical protein